MKLKTAYDVGALPHAEHPMPQARRESWLCLNGKWGFIDKTGSFVWPLIDGKKSIADLAKDVDARFGEEAHPLYERLAKFFQILDSYGFIVWVKK